MKMRIRGNSIRMRLTKTEINQIENGLPVRETLSFGGGIKLLYSLVPSKDIQVMRAEFDQKEIRVLLPLDLSREWALSDTISVKHGQPGQTDEPFLLIEKDFVCLKPRQHEVEDETDLFQNPNEAHGSCG
jgi:hypothetical protein